MHKLIRTNVRISKLPASRPPEGIRPNNPERDPRPGRYSIVGAFIKRPDSVTANRAPPVVS